MDDAIYATSTQHRLFNFTPKQLSDLRHATNKAATDKITESIRRREAANSPPSGDGSETSQQTKDEAIECPTADEELKLVAYYCVKCMQLADHFQFPSNVKVSQGH